MAIQYSLETYEKVQEISYVHLRIKMIRILEIAKYQRIVTMEEQAADVIATAAICHMTATTS